MLLSDALSQLLNTSQKHEMPLDISMGSIVEDDPHNHIRIDLLHFGPAERSQLAKIICSRRDSAAAQEDCRGR